MADTAKMGRKREGPPDRQPLVDDELADQLLGRAQAEGAELLGPEGLLSQVTKAVLERALAEEMTGHLGYEKHDPAGRGSGNSRNGMTAKTVLTDVGAVDLAVPRDRNGTFEPRIVRKGQTRLEGFNERIIALYARGMTTRDIRAHLREMYDVDVSPDLISRVTDGVVEELQEWQSRPLDRVYPVIFIDALMVKIRDGVVTNRPVYLAIGIDCDGRKQVLGLWVGPATGESCQVLAAGLVGDQEPRCAGCVHAGLRRAERPARRRQRGVGEDYRANLHSPSSAEFIQVRLKARLGADRERPQARVHRGVRSGSAGQVRRFLRQVGETLPGYHTAVGERVGGIRPIPGLRPGNKDRHLHHQRHRIY